VDITTTPKKEGAEEQQQPLDGRLGHIEEGEGDTKPAANGAPTLSSADIQVRSQVIWMEEYDMWTDSRSCPTTRIGASFFESLAFIGKWFR
jgi:hypothetical protein